MVIRDVDTHIKLNDFDIVVTEQIEHSKGVHTYDNGDPGEPPFTDVKIISIMYNGRDIQPLIKFFELEDEIMELLEDFREEE